MRVLADAAPEVRSASARWTDLRARVVSAVLLGPPVLFCIWGGGTPYAVMLLGAGLGLAWEWVALCGAAAPGLPGLLVLLSIVAGAGSAMVGHAGVGMGLLILGAGVLLVLPESGPRRWALAAGVPYIGVGVIALLWLRADASTGLLNLLFLLLLVWSSDVGAYVVGRLIGGAKLAPAISPGKTRSGAIGGLLAATATALLIASFAAGALPVGRVAAIAVGLGVAAQAGDLLESLIKRNFGVKDSSRLIPGHGGLLDRLDALLIAAPVAALLALWSGPGVNLWQ